MKKVTLLIITVIIIFSCSEDNEGDNNSTSPSVNNPPEVHSVTASPATIEAGETTSLSCVATDADGDNLNITWSANEGSFPNGTNGSSVQWQAPSTMALISANDNEVVNEKKDKAKENKSKQNAITTSTTYTISVTVSDGKEIDQGSVSITVEESGGTNNPPASPSNPNPSDNATEVSTSTTLSWSCSDPDGDPLTYDIYFGTSSNPSLVKSNHSTKSYDPGSLSESTTYYWKIVAKDDQSNSATSSVWNFTTAQGNQPPTTPSSPNPGNNATEVSTSTTLSWECSDPDGDPLTYDIYFATSPDPSLVKSNHTSKSYDPGSLIENTTYYWEIVAKDDQSNSSTSSVWMFTTWEEVSMGEPCPGIPTVTYEGKTYNTVLIGEQCWLKENLDVGTMIESNSGGYLQTDNGIIEKYCYDNDPANCETYGGLYEWPEALQYDTTEGVQGICPDGWHVPSLVEFEELKTKVNNDGNALKSIGEGNGNGAGTNTTGFSALLVGSRYSSGVFTHLGDYAIFWSSTKFGGWGANHLNLYSSSSNIYLYNNFRTNGYSIRCIKN